MPLCTAIYDADTTTRRKLPNGWGWWHVEVLTWLARVEQGWPKDVGLLQVWSLNHGSLEVTAAVGFKDPADGEVLILNPGDRVEFWRE
jgi:hypothetical protein